MRLPGALNATDHCREGCILRVGENEVKLNDQKVAYCVYVELRINRLIRSILTTI